MPRYLITREVPGIHQLSADELAALSAKSNEALTQVQSGHVQWVQSYVVPDGLVCVYYAESEEQIREHARIGGFPCNKVQQISDVLDPVTGGV